ERLLELIREYAVGMVTDDRNVRQLPDRQRKDLSAAENRVAGQQRDRPGESCVALRLDVPGLPGCIVILAWTDLRRPVEGYPLAVAKPVDDRDDSTVVAAG